MFKLVVHTKYQNHPNRSNFAEVWQQEQQKVQDKVNIIRDPLLDRIVPQNCVPVTMHPAWRGANASVGPQTTAYKYIGRNPEKTAREMREALLDSNRTRSSPKNDVLDQAVANQNRRIPTMESHEAISESNRRVPTMGLRKQAEETIAELRKQIELEKDKELPGRTPRGRSEKQFMLRRWKGFVYGIAVQKGIMGPGDLHKYRKEFVSHFQVSR